MLDENLGFLEAVEDLAVEQFIAQFPVEAFAVAVLPRAAGRDVQSLGPQASVSRLTLDCLFDSYTMNPLLPFELRCCVDRLSRQPKRWGNRPCSLRIAGD